MTPPISPDEDVNLFFDRVAEQVHSRFGIAPDEAARLTEGYYRQFNDEAYRREIGLNVEDDLQFFDDSEGGMAIRIYYSMVLKGDPDPDQFIEWRSAYYKARTAGLAEIPGLPCTQN